MNNFFALVIHFMTLTASLLEQNDNSKGNLTLTIYHDGKSFGIEAHL